ncbi:MAG: hypothetical protein H6644_01390 [Caldilineaceae bacterium]|nr:hypothetical protein [Caldilineaceae bacterium]
MTPSDGDRWSRPRSQAAAGAVISTPATLLLTIEDDDTAGIDVATGVTTTTEAGGSFAISYTSPARPPPPWSSPSRPATRAKPPSRRAAHLRRRDVGPAPSRHRHRADDDVADGAVAFA